MKLSLASGDAMQLQPSLGQRGLIEGKQRSCDKAKKFRFFNRPKIWKVCQTIQHNE